MSITQGLIDVRNTAVGVLKENPITTAIGIGVSGVAIGVGGAALVGAIKKKRKYKHKNSRKKSYNSRKSRRSTKSKYARTAGKRKDTSHRRIRMTKNGQPYIIMASGKARFISKSSARMSRRRKGGKY